MLNSAKKDHHNPNYVNGLQNAIIFPGSCSRLSNADFEKLLIFLKKALNINWIYTMTVHILLHHLRIMFRKR